MRCSTKNGVRVLALAAFATGVLGQESASDDGFAREGGAERRAALAEIETMAFSPDLVEEVEALNDAWTRALENYSGRVLVLTRWGVDGEAEMAHARAVANLAKEYPTRIAVLAIYQGDQRDRARSRAQQMGLPAGYDPSGEVAERFGLDEVSDVTLVDLAGRVRIADIKLEDFSRAMGTLNAESAEAAEEDLERREAFEAVAERAATQMAEQQEVMAGLMIDDEPPAPASAYEQADWPSPAALGRYATDLQGDPMPPGLDSARWLRMPEESLDDRVVVLDFWATWCGPCHMAEPGVVEAMKKHDGKVAVIGVSNVTWNQESAERVDNYLEQDGAPYSAYAHDTSQALWNAFGIRAIPHVAIVSTDGVVRWQGNANDPAFFKALDATVDADPGFGG